MDRLQAAKVSYAMVRWLESVDTLSWLLLDILHLLMSKASWPSMTRQVVHC